MFSLHSLWLSISLFTLSISLFLYGFFPFSIKTNGKLATHDELLVNKSACPGETKKASVDKLVFIVIDAWRLSFLTQDSSMSFIRSSIFSGHASAFDARVQTPTVTMPRIKALTSGTVPSFSSVLLNFGASKATEDSWLRQAKNSGKRIIFYGDDTWLSLFDDLFERSEGVVSFFVKDYTEVDNNVTRHIDRELSAESIDSWDVMILHYLGLDHIGHSLGGESPQIGVKLGEMDKIIEKLHSQMKEKTSSFGLLLVGDHGMTSSGGHGGASEQETRVPIVIWEEREDTEKSDKRESLGVLPQVEQIDVANMVSHMMDIPIPQQSVGIPFTDKIVSRNRGSFLHSLLISANNLVQFVEKLEWNSDNLKTCRDELHRKLSTCDTNQWLRYNTTPCMIEMREAQEIIIRNTSSFSFGFVLTAVTLSFVNLVLLFINLSSSIRNWSTSHEFFIITNCLHFCSFFASSLVEEEHDVRYFFFGLAILVEMIVKIKGRITLFETKKEDGKSHISVYEIFWCCKELLGMSVLHRLCIGAMAHTRRRNNMAEGTYPEAFLEDPVWLSGMITTAIQFFGDFGMSTVPVIFYISFFVYISYCHYLTDRNTLNVLFHTALISSLYPQFNETFRFYGFLIGMTVSIYQRTPRGFLYWTLFLCRPQYSHVLFMSFIIGQFSSLHPILLSYALNAGFFYMGNSNSLSTIDISVGYSGLSNYIPLIVGAQIVINTYSIPIMMLIGYWSCVKKNASRSRTNNEMVSLLFLSRSTSLLGSLLSMLIFSQHLFVWSVFAPRCLYEVVHCLIMIIMFVIGNIVVL